MRKWRFIWFIVVTLLLGSAWTGGGPAGVSAQGTGEISGTVTNIIGSPLSGIEVWLYRQVGETWTFYTWTTTDIDGNYTITNLEAESYRLHFRDWGQTYAYEYYNNVSRLAQATDIPVTDGEIVTIDVELELAGRIQGTVTGPGGQPLDYGYVFVHEYESENPAQPLFVTQPNGINYEFGGLPTGDYKILFSGQVNGSYYNEYYLDQYDFSDADPVSVVTGFTTANIDGVIGEPVNAEINGVVRNTSGSPLAGIEVSLYRFNTTSGWQLHHYMNSGNDGAYSFSELLSGTYRLHFKDWGQTYAFEYYNDAIRFEDATDILVGENEQVTIPDVILDEAGRIAGTLTAPDGSLLENAFVFVFQADPERGDVLYLQSVNNGTFDIGGLPTGDYYTQFSGRQGLDSYTEYYNDRPDWDSADPIPVIAGQTTGGIAAILGETPGGAITGQVTDMYGRAFDLARVNAYVDNGGTWDLFKTKELTYYESEYEITLPAGTYRLEFEGESFLNPGNPTREVYDDVQTLTEGTDITISFGETVSGINAALGNYATGSISGRVTDDSGDPVSGIEVYVYDRSFGLLWDQIAVTNGNGEYTVSGLWPESYFVEFYDPGAGYFNEYYDDSGVTGDATPVLVTYDAVNGIDAALEAAPPGTLPGHISGTVTDEGGNPLFGISVTASENGPGDFFGTARTASDGSYRVRFVPEISATVQFSDNDGDFITEWFDDAATEEEAEPVFVTNGSETGNIDAALELGGKITGTVTDAFGNDFPILVVSAFQFDEVNGEWVQVASEFGLYQTDYELGNLPAGSYRVAFSGQYFSGNGYSEFYDDVELIEDGTDVPVVAGQTTGGINAVLGPDIAGEISGTVTDGNGNGLPGITVRATEFNFGFTSEETTTGTGGTYVLENLYSGIYYVEFIDSAGTYPGEWYHDAPIAGYATPITVEDAPVTGIDAALDGANGGPGGGSITGRVTLEPNGDPAPGIEVRCYTEFFDPIFDCTTTTDANGDYFLGGFLPAGSYLVGFDDPSGGVAAEYYDDVSLIDQATPIPVVLGVSTTGIDAALTPAGFISGMLSGPDGMPLDIQSVAAYSFNGSDWEYINGDSWFFSDDPNYELGGLPEGIYRIRFSGGSISNPDQFVEYYDDVVVIEEGTDVAVIAGQVTPDINAILGDIYDGGISGRVTDVAGSGLDLVIVVAYREDGFAYRQVATDAQGNYTFTLLPEGDYYLGFFDQSGQYIPEYYDDQPSLVTATAINVTDSLITGIDAALSAESTITGRITDLNGDPLDFVQVTAFTLSGSDWITASTTFADPAGNYLLDELTPATYRLEFMGYRLVPGNPPEMFVEYYDDRPVIEEGTDIVLADGELLTGIDAQLGNLIPQGGINGMVMNLDGAGLSEVKVTVFIQNQAGQWIPIGEVMTGNNGEYLLSGLADHHYRLCFTDPAGNFDGECYNDVTDMNRATNVIVENGQTSDGIMVWLAGESEPPPPPTEPVHTLFLPIIAQSNN